MWKSVVILFAVFPLSPQQPVKPHIMATTITMQEFSVTSFPLKSQLLVQPNGRAIVGENGQLYTVEVAFVERKIQD
jgi:hypothetical protein